MDKRSFLFMPGNNPAMILSSDILGADAIILDLEDAVSLDEKDAARILVRNALHTLTFEHSKVLVRVNPIDSPYWQEDLDAIVPAQPDYILIPKADVYTVQTYEAYIEAIEQKKGMEKAKFFLLIEFPRSIIELEKIILSSDRTVGLALGAEDYTSYMGVNRTKEGSEILLARQVIATMGKSYGLETVDTPFTDVDDMEGLEKDTAFISGLGFTGKLSINPRQIDIIHEVLNPNKDEIEESLEIISLHDMAKEKGLGVFSYKGKMVDLPVVNRAETVVNKAKQWGLL